MHIPIHIMSGWCIGNLPPLTPRSRFFCMVAATICDVDGISYLFGQQAWWDYHHTFGHNLAFGVIVAVVLALLSRTAMLLHFVLYLALFHLHLLMDYYGSGIGWGIAYFWPFRRGQYVNPHAWAFYSWQNISVAAVLLIWTIAIARLCRRTPLEWVMPNLDRQLLELRKRR